MPPAPIADCTLVPAQGVRRERVSFLPYRKSKELQGFAKDCCRERPYLTPTRTGGVHAREANRGVGDGAWCDGGVAGVVCGLLQAPTCLLTTAQGDVLIMHPRRVMHVTRCAVRRAPDG